MFSTVIAKLSDCMNFVIRQNFSREQWIGISVVMLCLGLFFMRGFGSRTSY